MVQTAYKVASKVYPQSITRMLAILILHGAQGFCDLLFVNGALADMGRGTTNRVKSGGAFDVWRKGGNGQVALVFDILADLSSRIVMNTVNYIPVVDQHEWFFACHQRHPFLPKLFPPGPNYLLHSGRLVDASVI
jgi:hypothetical protein